MTLVKLTFSLARSARRSRQQAEPRRARQRPGGRRAEHRAERVGAGVAEHGPLAEVLGQQREGERRRAATAGGPASRRRAARAAGRAPRPRSAPADSGRATLIARPGRRSKRLSRFAPPATRPALTATSAGLAGLRAAPQRARQAGRAQAAELDRARGDLAVGQRAEVAAQAAALARAAQVVEDAERRPRRGRPGRGEQAEGRARSGYCGGRRPTRSGDRGGDDLRRDRAGGHGGALEERDRLAAVVGPRPGLLAGRRVPRERPRRRRAPRRRPRGTVDRRLAPRAGRGGAAPLHFFVHGLPAAPVAFECRRAGGRVGVAARRRQRYAGLTADAPEIP